MSRLIEVLGAAVLIASICFIGYGIKHQCKDIAIYTYCENK